jgi:phytoene dehydrogenase-like protein
VRAGVGTDTFDIVVIGGGVSGGLPAASYLQKAGLRVVIVEANSDLGLDRSWIGDPGNVSHG